MLIHLFDQSNSHAQSHNTVGIEGFRLSFNFFPKKGSFVLIISNLIKDQVHGRISW